MKRIIYLVVALLLSLATVGCVIENGGYKEPQSVGTWIWNTVAGDFELVHDMMGCAYYVNNYLALDEDDKDLYLDSYLNGYEFSKEGDAYVLSRTTSINSKVEMKFTYTGESLNVVRTGGNYCELIIKPTGEDTYDVYFVKLHNKASSGSARFTVDVIIDDTNKEKPLYKEVKFVYTGNMSMVDTEESAKKPLTYEVVIDEALQYSLLKDYITAGRLHIECWDAVYNSHDSVSVVFSDSPRQIYVSSYGKTETVYYNY